MIFVGNPPFQNKETRGKTHHKLWIDFTQHVYKQMKAGDKLLWITPQSWGSPSSKILQIFRESEIKYIDFDTGIFFPEVGSSFSDYLLIKSDKNNLESILTKNGADFNMTLDDSITYLPNDVCEESLSIHNKVIFSQNKKLPVKFDYTTCHNILIKKSDSLSKTKTNKHTYPVFHTNNQIWWSSKKQSFLDKNKVLWSRSGYTKPIYDDGNLGITDMGYYVLCSSEKEGQNLKTILNSKLFSYIFDTAKWSGFGNEKVFLNLPDVRQLIFNSDVDVYNWFNLSKEEIQFIESRKNIKKTKVKKVKKLVKSKERSDNLGEVFTPTTKVIAMLAKLEQEDYKQKFIDPACGNGQFLFEIIKNKMNIGMSYEESIKSTYGVDLMEDNISECKERILSLCENINEEIVNIINNNIICEDSLKLDYYLTFST